MTTTKRYRTRPGQDVYAVSAQAGCPMEYDPKWGLLLLVEGDVPRVIAETSFEVPASHAPPPCCVGTPVPHNASSQCRSGRRNHCTCDTCF